MIAIRPIPALFALLLSLAPLSAHAEVVAEEGWVRAGPPTARVFGAYVTLRNTGEEARSVTAVESADFERVEMHRTIVEGEVARMVAQERLEIPAGGHLSLKPGADHLMLFNPRHAIEEGGTVNFTLTIDDGSTLDFDAPVRRPDAGGQSHSHGHKH